MNSVHSKFNKFFIFLFIIVSFILIIKFCGITRIITFDNFKNNKDYLVYKVNKNYFLSVFVFISIYFISVILALPLAGLLSAIGGFLFGTIISTIYADIAATSGAIVSFLVFRYILGNYLQKKYSSRLYNFNKNIQKYGAFYLFMMHVATVPFFITNSLAAMTNLPLKTFIIATSLGIIPGCLVYAYAGKELGSINSFSEIFSFKILLAFLFLFSLSFLSFCLKWFKERYLNHH